jgi:hypothetical protein
MKILKSFFAGRGDEYKSINQPVIKANQLNGRKEKTFPA